MLSFNDDIDVGHSSQLVITNTADETPDNLWAILKALNHYDHHIIIIQENLHQKMSSAKWWPFFSVLGR